MPISRAQQILIKRAQREAGLSDADYRDALESVSGCRSTTDQAITDRGVDLFLAYAEAIHWRAADFGALQPSCKADAVFRQRGYWQSRNPAGATTRDRFMAAHPGNEIAALEHQMRQAGYGPEYCAAIRRKVTKGRDDPQALFIYRRALERTLCAKRKKQLTAANPF